MRIHLLLVVFAVLLLNVQGAERRAQHGKQAHSKQDFVALAAETKANAQARAKAVAAAKARRAEGITKNGMSAVQVHSVVGKDTKVSKAQSEVANKIKKIFLRKRAREAADNETLHDGGSDLIESKWTEVQNHVIDYHQQQIVQDVTDFKNNLVAALSMQTVVHNNEQDTIHQAYKASAGLQELQQMLVKQSIATRNNAEVDAFSKNLADTVSDDVFYDPMTITPEEALGHTDTGVNADETVEAPAPAAFLHRKHHKH